MGQNHPHPGGHSSPPNISSPQHGPGAFPGPPNTSYSHQSWDQFDRDELIDFALARNLNIGIQQQQQQTQFKQQTYQVVTNSNTSSSTTETASGTTTSTIASQNTSSESGPPADSKSNQEESQSVEKSDSGPISSNSSQCSLSKEMLITLLDAWERGNGHGLRALNNYSYQYYHAPQIQSQQIQSQQYSNTQTQSHSQGSVSTSPAFATANQSGSISTSAAGATQQNQNQIQNQMHVRPWRSDFSNNNSAEINQQQNNNQQNSQQNQNLNQIPTVQQLNLIQDQLKLITNSIKTLNNSTNQSQTVTGLTMAGTVTKSNGPIQSNNQQQGQTSSAPGSPTAQGRLRQSASAVSSPAAVPGPDKQQQQSQSQNINATLQHQLQMLCSSASIALQSLGQGQSNQQQVPSWQQIQGGISTQTSHLHGPVHHHLGPGQNPNFVSSNFHPFPHQHHHIGSLYRQISGGSVSGGPVLSLYPMISGPQYQQAQGNQSVPVTSRSAGSNYNNQIMMNQQYSDHLSQTQQLNFNLQHGSAVPGPGPRRLSQGGPGIGSGIQGQTSQNMNESPMMILQNLRNLDGHMGVDIGGTLAKLVLLLPSDIAAKNPFPNTIGRTGRTHENLEVTLEIPQVEGPIDLDQDNLNLSESIDQQSLSLSQQSQLQGRDSDTIAQQFIQQSEIDCQSLSTATDLKGQQELVSESTEDNPSNDSRNTKAQGQQQSTETVPSFEFEPNKRVTDNHTTDPGPPSTATQTKKYVLKFLSGNTAALEHVVLGIKQTLGNTAGPFSNLPPRSVAVAGGGAHKYSKLFKEALNLRFEIHKEMQSVVEGLRFVLERPDIFKDEVQVIGESGEEESLDLSNPYHWNWNNSQQLSNQNPVLAGAGRASNSILSMNMVNAFTGNISNINQTQNQQTVQNQTQQSNCTQSLLNNDNDQLQQSAGRSPQESDYFQGGPATIPVQNLDDSNDSIHKDIIKQYQSQNIKKSVQYQVGPDIMIQSQGEIASSIQTAQSSQNALLESAIASESEIDNSPLSGLVTGSGPKIVTQAYSQQQDITPQRSPQNNVTIAASSGTPSPEVSPNISKSGNEVKGDNSLTETQNQIPSNVEFKLASFVQQDYHSNGPNANGPISIQNDPDNLNQQMDPAVPTESPLNLDDPYLRFLSEPFLLVNIGSGVSILHVTQAGFARVGGTGCGGGTFLGLARLLCKEVKTYEEALKLASEGDATTIDTLVADIYGEEGSSQLGLPGSLTASNFGKLGTLPAGHPDLVNAKQKDLARACLQLVIQQVAVLARAFSESLNTQKIFFTGGFLERNKVAKRMVSNSMRSLGKQAFFPRHCDFLGAIGSLAYSLDLKEIEI